MCGYNWEIEIVVWGERLESKGKDNYIGKWVKEKWKDNIRR